MPDLNRWMATVKANWTSNIGNIRSVAGRRVNHLVVNPGLRIRGVTCGRRVQTPPKSRPTGPAVSARALGQPWLSSPAL